MIHECVIADMQIARVPQHVHACVAHVRVRLRVRAQTGVDSELGGFGVEERELLGRARRLRLLDELRQLGYLYLHGAYAQTRSVRREAAADRRVGG